MIYNTYLDIDRDTSHDMGCFIAHITGCHIPSTNNVLLALIRWVVPPMKLECSKQVYTSDASAWDNKARLE